MFDRIVIESIGMTRLHNFYLGLGEQEMYQVRLLDVQEPPEAAD